VSAKPGSQRILTGPRPALPAGAELADRLSHSPFLVALDIDGTLAPIAPTPERAVVPEATRRTVERLTQLPNVHVAFVTGRAARDGQRLVNVNRSWTIGNHGIESIEPTGALRVNESAEAFAAAIAEAARLLRGPLSRFQGVIVEDKKWTISVHFRLAKPDDVPDVERAITEVARRLDLKILEGKKIFELRPPVAINKGTALLELGTRLGVFDDGALEGSLLYIGDDQTDEDAFRALPPSPANVITVHVGTAELQDGQPTIAEFLLDDPAGVHRFLEWLTSIRDGIPART
jgi:trehalose-phosphatase